MMSCNMMSTALLLLPSGEEKKDKQTNRKGTHPSRANKAGRWRHALALRGRARQNKPFLFGQGSMEPTHSYYRMMWCKSYPSKRRHAQTQTKVAKFSDRKSENKTVFFRLQTYLIPNDDNTNRQLTRTITPITVTITHKFLGWYQWAMMMVMIVKCIAIWVGEHVSCTLFSRDWPAACMHQHNGLANACAHWREGMHTVQTKQD